MIVRAGFRGSGNLFFTRNFRGRGERNLIRYAAVFGPDFVTAFRQDLKGGVRGVLHGPAVDPVQIAGRIHEPVPCPGFARLNTFQFVGGQFDVPPYGTGESGCLRYGRVDEVEFLFLLGSEGFSFAQRFDQVLPGPFFSAHSSSWVMYLPSAVSQFCAPFCSRCSISSAFLIGGVDLSCEPPGPDCGCGHRVWNYRSPPRKCARIDRAAARIKCMC